MLFFLVFGSTGPTYCLVVHLAPRVNLCGQTSQYGQFPRFPASSLYMKVAVANLPAHAPPPHHLVQKFLQLKSSLTWGRAHMLQVFQ